MNKGASNMIFKHKGEIDYLNFNCPGCKFFSNCFFPKLELE